MSLKINILIITFIAFILISPWVYPVFYNRNEILSTPIKINYQDREILISEVNSLRGEVVGVINPVLVKILTNRLVLTGRHYINIYFQSFDPGFLFFSGTDDPLLSTRNTGALYVVFLPLMLVGIYRLLIIKKIKWLAILLLIISPLPATIMGWPLNPILLILFLLTLTFFTATGLTYLSSHKKLFILFLTLLVFETLRFWHIFFNHYFS